MRTHVDLQVGQLWRSSDPRRLTAFTITDIIDDEVEVEYLGSGRVAILKAASFAMTGPKGYVLVHARLDRAVADVCAEVSRKHAEFTAAKRAAYVDLVRKTPFATVVLLEGANIGQLYRMWTEHTAAGQSLWSWMSVFVALALWLNFYLVITPEERAAINATRVGLVLNALVIASVIYWRYL